MTSFYSPVKIGSLSLAGNIFLAPVAGYSDKTFRSICRDWGADFTYTEMISSEAMTRDSVKTEQLAARAGNEKQYAVQIFGADPERMAMTAQLISEKYNPECIDINAGCPMPKITKTGAGSALMKDSLKLYKIVKAVSSAAEKYGIPVTVKIRSGWTCSAPLWKEAAQAAVEAGAKAITMHPRSRQLGYAGKAQRSLIGELKQFLKPHGIPVFGSGDLFTPKDVKDMFESTGCDGIMLARGAMGNPFLFTQIKEYLSCGEYGEIPLKEKISTGLKELHLLCGEKGEVCGCREMRKRIASYTKGSPDGARLREKLVRASSIADYEELLSTLIN